MTVYVTAYGNCSGKVNYLELTFIFQHKLLVYLDLSYDGALRRVLQQTVLS